MTNEEAIKSLNNIIEYWTHRPTEVEAAKIAIQAIEKQTPQKVIYKHECVNYCPPDCGTPKDDEYEDVPHCPICDYEVESFPQDKFCKECGQKLEW